MAREDGPSWLARHAGANNGQERVLTERHALRKRKALSAQDLGQGHPDRPLHVGGQAQENLVAKLVSGQLVAGDDYGGLKPTIGIHLLDFDLFQDPAHREQSIWCFEMRDEQTPTVTLGQELQLNLIELRKADRLQRTTGALAAWIALFEHWQEDHTMSQIADEPVRAALDKLEHLSADAETRRLAFVRERALLDERSLLKDTREEGKAEALRQTAINLIRSSGLDDAAIAGVTGLNLTDIDALRKQVP